ncbi:hypothetical protein MH117_21975 [Paenibacillus sp. ACRRX]|uniref:hypothetical protein n=1 Tax=unclassified Paenibacillus TaxID=185978 RepID=UPI001EF66F21|nr:MULTISPECIES: hypothetical protein [unclassified Paenibacillus]MCG7410085.1 hypothetical protein [Paenibacillus sp. ACRRX]MDK8183659.1 hypothetical protein [Paenibacillus sp. UMB4589-SE434]
MNVNIIAVLVAALIFIWIEMPRLSPKPRKEKVVFWLLYACSFAYMALYALHIPLANPNDLIVRAFNPISQMVVDPLERMERK